MLAVETRLAGKKQRDVDRWSVPIPPTPDAGPGDGGLTLRDLISSIVRSEVEGFALRQRGRRLVRVLSEREMEAGAARGRIDPGGREPSGPVDPEAAVGAALTGFEDGLYLVFLDGRELRELDAQVHLGADSRLTLLRLVFLAGA